MMDPPASNQVKPMDIDEGPKSILTPPKVKKHGAAVVLAAEEVKTSFTADFTLSTASGTSSKLNIGNLHRLLFLHVLEAAEDQTIHLLPTQENPRTSQKSIGDLSLFPRIEKDHRDFFHRSTFHLHLSATKSRSGSNTPSFRKLCSPRFAAKSCHGSVPTTFTSVVPPLISKTRYASHGFWEPTPN